MILCTSSHFYGNPCLVQDSMYIQARCAENDVITCAECHAIQQRLCATGWMEAFALACRCIRRLFMPSRMHFKEAQMLSENDPHIKQLEG